jgi:hypothetical protein
MHGEARDSLLERRTPASIARVQRPEPDSDDVLPLAGDPYQAYAMPVKNALTRLCCVMGHEGFRPGGKAYRFFQYVHLDSDTDLSFTPQGQVLTLRFAGMKPVIVTIRGRNLVRLCDYIHLHRMPWIRVADRDFQATDGSGDNEPIITGFQVVDAETGEVL